MGKYLDYNGLSYLWDKIKLYLSSALSTKVDKISSTDNAAARFNGEQGAIQNSGVIIDDNNNVTAAKFIKSGGTSSQFLKADGSVDSNTYLKTSDISSWAKASTKPSYTLDEVTDGSTRKLSDYQTKLTTQTVYTTKGSATKVPQITTNSLGQVTAITEITITQPTSFTITPTDDILDGTAGSNGLKYAPYASQQAKLSFDTSTTNPTRTDRLNLNGYLYATKLYSGGSEVLTSHLGYGSSASAISTTASAGSAATVSRSDHVHSIALATGDSAGQVKIAGTNVSVNGWANKADLASPAFTGTPTAPTAAAGTNSTQIATTAFVKSAVDGKVHYVANLQAGTAANYITEPEVKTVKINGSTTNSASTTNCVLQFDTTNQCLKFVFN